MRPLSFWNAIGLISLFTTSLGTAWSAGPRLDGDLLSITRSAAAAGVQDGLFDKEELTEEKALKMTQDLYGPVHPALVPVLNDLATLQRYCGRYYQAKENCRWGLAIREKTLGPNDPLVAESLDQLAGIEVDLGEFQEAQLHYQQAQKIQENMPLRDSLASTLADLGGLYLMTDRADEALPLLENSLTIHEKVWGPDDLKLVSNLELLSRAMAAKSNFDGAEKYLQRALTIRQKALSPEHPDISYSLEKLADLYQAQGKGAQAKDYYEKAFNIQKNFLSNKDFRSLSILHAAATTEFALGDLKNSEALLNTILKIRKETYGSSHPMVAFDLEDLAVVYETEHQKSKALTCLKEAKNILEKFLPTDHPEILKVEKSLNTF